MKFSDKVKKLRKQLGNITQRQLAKILDVSQSNISLWENDICIANKHGLEKLKKLSVKKKINISWKI